MKEFKAKIKIGGHDYDGELQSARGEIMIDGEFQGYTWQCRVNGMTLYCGNRPLATFITTRTANRFSNAVLCKGEI